MTILDRILSIFLKKKKVGLVLGGGVARGLAHIGVLKVLKKNNIPIHFLAGTSSGSLIGALFAAGMDPSDMESGSQRLGWTRFVKIVMERHGPASTEELKNFVIKSIGDIKFSDLKIPFAVSATSLMTGEEVVIREGSVASAVAASSAFPGFFVPVKHGPDLLIDGGIANNVPCSVAKKMGAEFIIAADVVPGNTLAERPENALQIFGRAFDLAIKKLSVEGRQMADVLIEPVIPQDIWHLDVGKAKRLISAGEEAAQSRILEIKTRLFL